MELKRKSGFIAGPFLMVFLIFLSGVASCHSRFVPPETTEPAIAQPDSDKSKAQFVWNEDKTCSACHLLEARSMTRDSLLAYQHALAGNHCLSCHDASDLKRTHKDVSQETAVRAQVKKYPISFCFKCHGGYEDLIQLTKDSLICTDAKGNVANPHDTHLGQSDCYNCHRVHRMSSGVNYCYSCHHANVFECGTCHVIPSKH